MRTGYIVFICLAMAISAGVQNATASTGISGQFNPGIMGLSSFGFPSMLVDPQTSLPVPADIRSPDAALALSASILAATSNPSALVPDTSTLGLSAMRGMGSYYSPMADPSIASLISSPGLAGAQVPYSLPQERLGDASSDASAYTETSNGKTIKVKLGDTFHVKLKANINQGYIWNMSVSPGLKVASEQAYPPENMNLLSGSGISGLFTQDWIVKAIEPGEQTISAIYKRSQTDGPPDNTFTLTVIVE